MPPFPSAVPRFALIAHDARKDEIVDWVGQHRDRLSGVEVIATGTTGRRIRQVYPDLAVTCVKSGPMGGDQQIGAMICEGQLTALIFFVDPLSSIPHDADVKALMRLATVYDLPMGCSRSTADLVVTGLLGHGPVERLHRASLAKGRIRDAQPLQWLRRRGRRVAEGAGGAPVEKNGRH